MNMIYKLVKRSGLLSPERRLEFYPPFRAMRIRVLRMENDGRKVVIRLPLNSFNRNPGGGMFGGAMASLADPIAALMCANIFPGNAVWTRHMEIDFIHEARTDLELRFSMDEEQEEIISKTLESKGRATPVFEYGFYDERDRLCAKIINRVAIRPNGYKKSDGALGRR
ncbi:hypothetical protein BOV90_10365 [Solemya velum gill symbiont]|uniref:DUF4442 domain-containing protein n=2 Tax=Solemya velum gill symbiont TaxID=2340 RepID=A0A0B0H997_SOVGS|nr:DUF4442 domain-containing protein [Solemya velum gill symbiont]KHF24414.1 hypothetical protein JV46_28040 [Solemya velum gill symbiont]OOY34907.1 hypothetical protein BOV88_07230 [Solemya velum gill symbiont]OOY37340.1 hypothetical protein BOV89_08095 [Solemya velum gill symbiont]OOY39232.1 hypothetical protein BOV90_10365 [Solemya velum gill symbiont]OOY42419.1 hypothetical protein BOV91_07040 [Solemya velum gill symbiont]